MPTPIGKYTAADLAPDQPKTYTAADIDTTAAPTPAPPTSVAQPGMFSTMLGNARRNLSTLPDFGKGMAEGGFNTVGGLLKMVGAQKAGQAFTDASRPQNDAQSWGRGTEQAGEFMLPGMDGEALAAHAPGVLAKIPGATRALSALATRAPVISRAAPTLARIGAAAGASGALNAAQGGSLGAGALLGGAAGAIGAGAQALAPTIAETALKVRGVDRAYGATPGRAILDDTTGIRPSTIVKTGRDSMSNLQAEQAGLLAQSPIDVDMTPTRKVASDFLNKATSENHPGTIKDLTSLSNQVQTLYGSGAAIPQAVPAPQAAALNRGISNAITSWSPATANDTMNAAGKSMHHALGDSIAQAVPEVKPINQRMASLIPVLQRANAADMNAGPVQRTIARFGAHTGALGLGIGVGAKYGPLAGVGSLAGAELLASPEFWMTVARGANSKAAPVVLKGLAGTAAQAR